MQGTSNDDRRVVFRASHVRQCNSLVTEGQREKVFLSAFLRSNSCPEEEYLP